MTSTTTLPGHWKVLRVLGWGAAAFILAAPLVAMRFTDEVRWTAFDFSVMATMLLATGAACEIAVRTQKTDAGRFVICGIIGLVFVLTWAELAVGIFR
jgi:hypothetical protein